MLKNVAWDTKDKKISAVIFTVLFSSLLFFEVMRANYIEESYLFIPLTALAAVLFSLFFITSIEGKWNKLFSAQGITAVATVIVTLGMAESQKMGTTSKEGFYALLIASLTVLMAKNFYLLPIAAAISAVLSSFTTKPEIQSLVICCAPAVIGVSFVTFCNKIKGSNNLKKIILSIIFALTQPVLLASFGFAVYYRRYTITVHNLITEMWDSAASLVAVIVLFAIVVLAVPMRIVKLVSDKKKTGKEKTEAIILESVKMLGCLIVALMGILPMFMEMKIVFLSAMGLYMALLVISNEGSVADEAFNGALRLLNPKNKSKSKPKKKKI